MRVARLLSPSSLFLPRWRARRPPLGGETNGASPGDDYQRVTSLLRQQARLLFSLARKQTLSRLVGGVCLPDLIAHRRKSRSGDEFQTFEGFLSYFFFVTSIYHIYLSTLFKGFRT
jgi:hypothetical protein